jgi:hypothetical protein
LPQGFCQIAVHCFLRNSVLNLHGPPNKERAGRLPALWDTRLQLHKL